MHRHLDLHHLPTAPINSPCLKPVPTTHSSIGVENRLPRRSLKEERENYGEEEEFSLATGPIRSLGYGAENTGIDGSMICQMSSYLLDSVAANSNLKTVRANSSETN